MTFKSIRTRLMIWVLVISGLIVLSVITWSYQISRTRLEQEMETKATFLADGAARRVDARLSLMQGVVHGMALALETQKLQIPFDDVRAMQTRALMENPELYGVCVAIEPELALLGWPDLAAWEYRDGDGLKYEDLSGPSWAHIAEDWYTLPKNLDRPVWSEPYEWKSVIMVTYSVPLYIGAGDNRRFAGVITCDLNLEFLKQMMAELPLGKDGYGLLMSRFGTYIAHPMKEIVLNETVFSLAEERQDPELRKTGQRMISGEPGIEPFISFITRDLSWLAYTPLHSADWIMAALISRTEMNQAIVKLSWQQGLIGLGGLLLLCLTVSIIARTITRPISTLRDAADSLASGNLNVDILQPKGRDEVAALTRSFSNMRDDLIRYLKDLQVSTEAQERMNSELRIARGIQMGLVPKTFPPFPEHNDLDLYAVLEPAREVGGDFYDFFLIGGHKLVVSIGDVSGKGVPAALFMAVTRSFLRSAFHADSDPGRVLSQVNNQLLDGNDSCMFVTLFCGVLDLETGMLQYANAGHNAPLIRHEDGKMDWVSSQNCLVAGVMPSESYPVQSVMLPLGATLVLYTDGVTEAMNEKGELFADKRLVHSLERLDGPINSRLVTERVLAAVQGFADGAEQSDDITLLVLRRRPRPENMYHLVVENNLHDLERALEDLDRFAQAEDLGPREAYLIRLVAEELVLNTIKYGYDDNQVHQIKLSIQTGSPLLMNISDDGHPFNPLTDAPPPVLDGAIEDRPIGGLGLHTLLGMGLTLRYRYENNRNLLHVVFPNERDK
jgi:sigma-B regulation protein RsbU (phosphoserine phosphatase)